MKDYAVDPIDGAQADRHTRDTSSSLLHLAADLTRREADLLRSETLDPLALADRDVSILAADLRRAIQQATTVEAALAIHLELEGWRKALAKVELAALSRANDLLDGKD